MTQPKLSTQSSGLGGRGYRSLFSDGEVVPSVTTALGALEKPGITKWHIENTAAWASVNAERLVDMEPEQGMRFMQYYTRRLTEKKVDEIGIYDYSMGVLSDLAEVGDFVHNWVETDLNGGFPEDPWREDQEQMIEAYLKWKDENDVETVCTERTVFGSTASGAYAGTFDGILKVNGVTVFEDLKGLPLDTKIPTPSGWSTMGGLQVGDEVFSSSGETCRVTAKSEVHNNPCLKITFDNGREVIADEDHRWAVSIGFPGQMKDVVMTTRQMKERLETKKGQRDIRIWNAEPLSLPDQDLPIDPYVLGVWLGDGTASKAEVTLNGTTKSRIPDELRNRGWEVTQKRYQSEINRGTQGRLYQIGGTGVFGAVGKRAQAGEFKTLLQEVGAFKNKHLPENYLRSSISQRLDLLRGIMDTDGSWNTARNNEVQYSTTDKRSRDQVFELVSSLGVKAYLYENPVSWTYRGVKKTTTAYTLKFRPTWFNPFLAREYPFEPSTGTARSDRYLVRRIKEVDTVPTQCIEVSSEDHTYLYGEHMGVTHNTSRSLYDSHVAQIAALSAADTMAVEVPEGTPGAVYHKLSPKVSEAHGGQVDSWWLPEGLPGFEQFGILRIRPDDWDQYGNFIPAYCRMEIIPHEQVEAAFGIFEAGLAARHAQRHYNQTLKALEKEETNANH